MDTAHPIQGPTGTGNSGSAPGNSAGTSQTSPAAPGGSGTGSLGSGIYPGFNRDRAVVSLEFSKKRRDSSLGMG